MTIGNTNRWFTGLHNKYVMNCPTAHFTCGEALYWHGTEVKNFFSNRTNMNC